MALPKVVKKFWEDLNNNPDLDQQIVKDAQKEFEDYQLKKGPWVTYGLIAEYTAARPCLRCPGGIKTVTVKVNEVFKYGITRQSEERYTREKYRKLGVRFEPLHRGTFEECEALESAKIIAYRASPERFKPEAELKRPPGNAYRN